MKKSTKTNTVFIKHSNANTIQAKYTINIVNIYLDICTCK